jgi:hypothetical protein
MFSIESADENSKNLLDNYDKFFSPDVQKDLHSCLSQLKRKGETFWDAVETHPNVNGFVFRIDNPRFRITYTTLKEEKKVIIWSFNVHSFYKENEWLNYLSEPLSDDELNDKIYIPQTDRPAKIINALIAVSQGYKTSYDLGLELGHTGKDRSISRHGSYAGRTCCELKLLKASEKDRQYEYELTTLGQKIVSVSEELISERLLAQAIIEFHPIQVILEALTSEGCELSVEFIQHLIDTRLCPRDHTKKTSFRRAQAMRTWTIWLSETMGIPIYYKGTDGRQLYIPFIYSGI